MLYDVVVVGAGLCGLSSALLLKKIGLRVLVLEARSKPGGRIRSVRDVASGECLGDLGPTWIWPEQQPDVSRWLDSLGVSTFRQYAEGATLIDLGEGSDPLAQNMPAQPGTYRIDGGTSHLTDSIAGKLSDDELDCSAWVTHIDTSGMYVRIATSVPARQIEARWVIVAVPPRVAEKNIRFSPPLPQTVSDSFRQCPTWMAQHAKLVVLYAEAFWRERNLSGRIFSQAGPIAELQDHCAPIGYPAALTGFLAWDAQQRVEQANTLAEQISKQLARIFGAEAPEPVHIVIKDWAQDKCVAVPEDLHPGGAARQVLPDVVRQVHGNGKLLFASSELSKISPGLIEGAWVRAEEAVKQIG